MYTLKDGKLKIDNNLIKNSIRPVAIGLKNYLFAGNHEAAQRSEMLYSLFATFKRHNVNPIECLTYIFENINDHKINAIHELLPQNYAALIEKITGGRGHTFNLSIKIFKCIKYLFN